MKNKHLLSCLIAVTLAFGIAIAGSGCLVTAFELVNADMFTVLSVCALSAVICSVCFSFKRGWWIPALLAALLIGYLIREGSAVLELESLLRKITEYYNMAYGWGTVSWSGAELGHIPVTGGLALMAAVTAAVVAWVICRKRSAFFAIAVGFLPLAACFVVTDTIPGEGWVFLLLSCFAMIVLTQSVRKRDPQGAVRLTALLLVPVLLASGLLFWLNPQKDYATRMKETQQTLLSWFSDLPFVVTTPDGELTVSVDGLQSAQVDLAAVGPKFQLRYAVMDVTAENGGVIYLRGQSFDTYDGMSWSASEFASGEDPHFPGQPMKENGYINISVRNAQGRMYVPYYISQEYVFTDGYIKNEGRQRDYSFIRMEPEEGNRLLLSQLQNSNISILQQCLELPEQTRLDAVFMLNRAGIAATLDSGVSFSSADIAQKISSLVSQSARYDLDTAHMPAGETDFAIWFLEESDTGYCVHFASAATVLLRAAGIPARYVTGYMFEAQSGRRVTVRSNAAHAWVEYFDSAYGWRVLDATPPEWLEEIEETEPETAPVVTNPTTEPTTEPATEDTTEDTEPTVPDATEGDTTPIGGDKKIDFGPLWAVLKYLLWVGGVIAVIFGQYRLRISLRRRKMRTGHPNKRALERWRHVMLLARLNKAELPEELEALAEKAKFSQHTLTAQELRAFDVWLQQAKLAMAAKPWPLRFVIKLIWAIE